MYTWQRWMQQGWGLPRPSGALGYLQQLEADPAHGQLRTAVCLSIWQGCLGISSLPSGPGSAKAALRSLEGSCSEGRVKGERCGAAEGLLQCP